jgi:ABC-2 type transport system permease protein
LFVAAGAIWSISVIPVLFVGSAAVSTYSYDTKQDALVAVAMLLGIAWIVVPLLATGVDDSLDPARFASWGLDAKRLMPGLALAAFTTIPAIFFVAVAAVMAATWRGENRQGTVLLVAFIGAALTVMTWVFSARLATMWAVRLLATRGAKAVVASLAAIIVALLAAVGMMVRSDGLERVLAREVATLLTQTARTPIGAGFAAPSSIVLDNEWGAVWRLAMMAAWVVILYFGWRAAVAHALVNPVSRGAGVRRHRDAVLDTAGRTGFGWSRVPPVTRVVLARTARSWRSDPRYITQLVGAVVFPVIVGGLALIFAGDVGAWIAALPVALAVTIGWGRHNDLAYDSSGVWLDIVSGVRGVDVMRGRLLGVLLWAGPAVVVASVVAAGLARRWEIAPAIAATAVGALGLALGVASLTSITMPYRVPAPGESPFGADAGSIGASLAGQVVSSVGTGLAVPFIAAPLLCGFLWGGAWWALALVWGPVVGVGGAWLGTSLAGQWYDARAGKLVGAVS